MDVQGWAQIYVTEIVQILGIPTGTMSRKTQRFQAYALQVLNRPMELIALQQLLSF